MSLTSALADFSVFVNTPSHRAASIHTQWSFIEDVDDEGNECWLDSGGVVAGKGVGGPATRKTQGQKASTQEKQL